MSIPLRREDSTDDMMNTIAALRARVAKLDAESHPDTVTAVVVSGTLKLNESSRPRGEAGKGVGRESLNA